MTDYKLKVEYCQVDGRDLREHLRCALCGILMGPSHQESRGYETAKGLSCYDCSESVKRRAAGRVAWSSGGGGVTF